MVLQHLNQSFSFFFPANLYSDILRFSHRWFSIDGENRPFSQVTRRAPFNVYPELHRIVQK